jgi:hypothetical protein
MTEKVEKMAHPAPQAGKGPEQQAPVPGPVAAFYSVSSSYAIGPRDIWFSSAGQVVTSYTFDASTVAADANGDKIVREGTVLAATAGGKAKPRTGTETAIGVLLRRINVRDGDQEIGMVVGGHLSRSKLTDNGVFGSVAPSAEQDLRNLGVFLKP